VLACLLLALVRCGGDTGEVVNKVKTSSVCSAHCNHQCDNPCMCQVLSSRWWAGRRGVAGMCVYNVEGAGQSVWQGRHSSAQEQVQPQQEEEEPGGNSPNHTAGWWWAEGWYGRLWGLAPYRT
jgi:hypothetical protein